MNKFYLICVAALCFVSRQINGGMIDILSSDDKRIAFEALPGITSFSPQVAVQGDTITIKGWNFTGITGVGFGNIIATSYTILNDSTIEAIIDTGATGNVHISGPFGDAYKSGFKFVLAHEPLVDGTSSKKGDSGTIFYIWGKHLSTVSQVTFGGVPASSIKVIDDENISVVVGPGASGDIVITTRFGTATVPGFQFGPIPSITSFTPQTGRIGTTITITGKKLSSTTLVEFGGVMARSFTIVNDTLLTAIVDAGTSGNVSLSSDFGTTRKPGFFFSDIPVITSFSPLSDTVGATVTIYGRHFNTVATNNQVFFGAVPATVTSSTDTSISAIVPPGATFQPIRVTASKMTACSDLRFSIRFPGTADSLTTAATFDNKISFATSAGANYMTGIDLDGDGKSDLVTLNRSTGQISGYQNLSTVDSIAFGSPVTLGVGAATTVINFEDLDGDGKSDMFAYDISQQWFTTYKNTSTVGHISFAPDTYDENRIVPAGTASRDLDFDGKPDLVIKTGSDMIGIFRNSTSELNLFFKLYHSKDGKDSVTSVHTGGIPSGNVLLEDINRDGKADICVTSNAITNDSLFVFFNTSTPGNFQFGPRQNIALVDGGPAAAAAGDLDGDMIPDIAVAGSNSNNLIVFPNNSSGGNVALDVLQYPTGAYPTSIAIGDIDGDGKSEIATADSLDNTISIYKNHSTPGTVSLSGKITLQAGTAPGSLYIGDLNGDGQADIAALNLTKDSITIFRNKIGEPQVTSSGANPVTGPVTTTLVVDTTVQTHEGHPYVQRHYDINPANNPSTTTATITLYFTQEDFDNYNAHPAHGLNLPSGPGDLAGKAALRVYQYHGFSTTSLPGSYSGEGVEIDPDDAKIVWNPISLQWEVTFDVNGFSGFFIASFGNALPLQLISFTGTTQPGQALLKWETTDEVNVAYFDLQRSTNGQAFEPIATITARNNNTKETYNYTDQINESQVYHYRLKMTDKDGTYNFSPIVTLNIATNQSLLVLAPNPAHGQVTILHPASEHPAQMQLADMNGKIISTMSIGRQVTKTTMPLTGVTAGLYTIIWTDGSRKLNKVLFVQ